MDNFINEEPIPKMPEGGKLNQYGGRKKTRRRKRRNSRKSRRGGDKENKRPSTGDLFDTE